jgi:hypothetical protein
MAWGYAAVCMMGSFHSILQSGVISTIPPANNHFPSNKCKQELVKHNIGHKHSET